MAVGVGGTVEEDSVVVTSSVVLQAARREDEGRSYVENDASAHGFSLL